MINPTTITPSLWIRPEEEFEKIKTRMDNKRKYKILSVSELQLLNDYAVKIINKRKNAGFWKTIYYWFILPSEKTISKVLFHLSENDINELDERIRLDSMHNAIYNYNPDREEEEQILNRLKLDPYRTEQELNGLEYELGYTNRALDKLLSAKESLIRQTQVLLKMKDSPKQTWIKEVIKNAEDCIKKTKEKTERMKDIKHKLEDIQRIQEDVKNAKQLRIKIYDLNCSLNNFDNNLDTRLKNQKRIAVDPDIKNILQQIKDIKDLLERGYDRESSQDERDLAKKLITEGTAKLDAAVKKLKNDSKRFLR